MAYRGEDDLPLVGEYFEAGAVEAYCSTDIVGAATNGSTSPDGRSTSMLSVRSSGSSDWALRADGCASVRSGSVGVAPGSNGRALRDATKPSHGS